MQRFGEKVRALRKQQGMTLKQLAEALGLTTHSHLSNIKTGRKQPSLELTIKIADLFEVTVDQLVRDNLDLD